MDRRSVPYAAVSRRFAAPASVALALVLLVATAPGCATLSGGGGDASSAPADTVAAVDTAAAVPATIAADPAARRRTAQTDTAEAGRFDQGRMWTFDDPPTAYFEEEYDFDPSEEWFRRARLGALRLPNCTASFVSPRGLVLTNHHCARTFAASTAEESEQLIENGFYAETQERERRVDDLYADQLVAIEDVTGAVEAALDDAQTDAERAEAQRQVFEEIKQRRNSEVSRPGDLRTEVVALYDGARYSAYTFRRYTDVRLVMIPEADVGYFGGAPDNFTYPRYTFDVSFLRVYGEDGEPLSPEAYFPFAEEGSAAGEPVFVVGNPGSTSRLETVSQLAFRRDVSDRALLAFLESRRAAFEASADETPSEQMENRLFELRNAIKLYRGRLDALEDPYILARRRDAQADVRAALDDDPALQEQYVGALSEMEQIQEEKRALADQYRAFLLMENSRYSSATLRRALTAKRLRSRRAAGAPEEQLADLREELLGVSDQPAELDRRLLEARLRDLQEHLGDTEAAQDVLAGRPPSAAAREIVEASALRSSETAREALAAGTLSSEDPALEAVSGLYTLFQDFQSARSGLEAQQQQVARRLGQARYDEYGNDVPPDATFSLRIADGRVSGYEYNGTVAPPYTSFYGIFDHYHAYGDDTPWDLPTTSPAATAARRCSTATSSSSACPSTATSRAGRAISSTCRNAPAPYRSMRAASSKRSGRFTRPTASCASCARRRRPSRRCGRGRVMRIA
ncbi:MAG: S46 family peptidase [Bacteroidetes bacterium QS_8_68_15]|nr:MAG: S46 family peptidase [Bacteroidetes bacterium QS_8_68_15]